MTINYKKAWLVCETQLCDTRESYESLLKECKYLLGDGQVDKVKELINNELDDMEDWDK